MLANKTNKRYKVLGEYLKRNKREEGKLKTRDNSKTFQLYDDDYTVRLSYFKIKFFNI